MAGLASRLSRRGHEVTLLTLDGAANDRHPVDVSVVRRGLDQMRVTRGWMQKVRYTVRRIRTIRKALLELNPDVVLSFCDRTNILVLLAVGGRAIPVVIAERSEPSCQHLGRFWEYQRRRTYPRAARIVALTESSAATLAPLTSSPVEVIPSAVDQPPRISNRVLAAANQRIVGIGRLEPEKGFDRLIEAFATVAGRHPEWSLRIIGEGSQLKTLRLLAGQRGVAEQVSFAGWIRPIWDELAAATIFALPSRYEGFPSALLEAMAVGVPCIAVDCESGPRAILTHQTDGLLVPNTTADLAQGLQRMIEQPERREQWAVRGISVAKRFSWNNIVNDYERILQQAIAEAGET